jgi:integrase
MIFNSDLMQDPKAKLAQINNRLQGAALPVRLVLRGQAIALQATLPGRDGGPPRQQQIALRWLGITASVSGFQQAELKAHELSKELALGSFAWDRWTPQKERPKSCTDWVREFEEHYRRTHRLSGDTWKIHWREIYRRLPEGSPLDHSAILGVILKTESGTRLRKQACDRLQRLADFAGIAIDLKPYQGNYSQSKVQRRDLPPDELIEGSRILLPSLEWQNAYGLLACFGIRPHELWYCELIEATQLKVIEGKTGGRIARALHPEWAEGWGLSTEVSALPIKGKSQTYQKLGQRVYCRFRANELPFNPYDLRHAYAIRGSVIYRMPRRVMAGMMGHSESVHSDIYNRWLREDQAQQVYEEIVLSSRKPTDEPRG